MKKSYAQGAVHTYNDINDQLATREFECSEVYGPICQRSLDWKPKLVFVKTTGFELVLYGDCNDKQYRPDPPKDWPSSGGPYYYGFRLANIRDTTRRCVKLALYETNHWSSSLRYFPIMVNEHALEPTRKERAAAWEQVIIAQMIS